jgi:hypothetical protein
LHEGAFRAAGPKVPRIFGNRWQIRRLELACVIRHASYTACMRASGPAR